MLKKKLQFSIFLKNPQLKGTIFQIRIVTPRKPNSGKRTCAKTFLSIKKNILSFIPGKGHNLKKYSITLIKKGGKNDLPNVSYSCIRGIYDFFSNFFKKKKRSIFGIKKK